MKDVNIDNIIAGNAPKKDAGIFGLPFDATNSKLILLPVPWEATASYGRGTSLAPEAILKASHQLDLFDLQLGEPYKKGIYMDTEKEKILTYNDKCTKLIEKLNSKKDLSIIEAINSISAKVNQLVEEKATLYIKQNKLVGVVGGEHSAPFGLIKALSKKHSSFGILHFDAHLDLRDSYEEFTWSHASIMFNVVEHIPEVSKIVHVGIRDFCQPEFKKIQAESQKLSLWSDNKVFREKASGTSFAKITEKIIGELPQLVYISFDIDGLEPANCPHTGTPVPGGLSFQEACYIIEKLAIKKEIIGFDLCEVCPSMNNTKLDENIGARILYKLCGAILYNKTQLPISTK
jgi:agmatinase